MTDYPFIHKKALTGAYSSFIYNKYVAKIIPFVLDETGIINIGGKRREIYLFAKKFADKKIKADKKKRIVVLFHAASAGEFEQLKPVLKEMDRNKFFILQSFFSPTVYKNEKNTKLADSVCYHPFDFFWSAWFFFRRMNIQYYITTRNDIWPTHLYIANLMGIHTALINANLYRESHYKSYFLRNFHKNVLRNFDLILTGSERLKKNLMYLVPENKIHITGDSRFDRVLERKNDANDNLLPKSYKKSKTIILGSIETSDYPILFSGLKKYYPNGQDDLENNNHRLIIVPHEIDSQNLHRIYTNLTEIGFDVVNYSEKDRLQESRVVIIDLVGILADLYRYADLAYVGSGFNDGIHSVLEPAVYTNAISFGPKYHIVDMAVSLADLRLAAVIHSSDDFSLFLNLLDNNDKLNEIHTNMKDYISKQKLASEQIINKIFKDATI